jgi:predicted MFS family arabinose efflux permease
MPGVASPVSSVRSYVVVWLVLVFAWTANFTIRTGFASLLPPIMRELDLSYTRAGVLAAGFFYAYALLQVPAGVLGDRFGRRRVLVTGLVLGAVACAVTGVAASFAALLVARVLTGASQASLFSNDRAIIVSVTPAEKIALGQGISFSGPGLGLVLGLALGGVLGDRVSWRVVFFLFALGPLAAALLVRRFVPPSPGVSATGAARARVRAVLGRPDLWMIGAASACAIYVQFVLATWAPMFFIEAGVGDLARAGAYAATQGVAAVGGLIVGGWVADAVRRHGVGGKLIMAASLAALTLTMIVMSRVLAHHASPLALGVTLVLAAFFVWSTWGPVYALIGELSPGAMLGTAFGFSNTISFVGAMVGPTVTGWARDATGSFSAGCAIAAAVAAAGALIAVALRPRRPAVLPHARAGAHV